MSEKLLGKQSFTVLTDLGKITNLRLNGEVVNKIGFITIICDINNFDDFQFVSNLGTKSEEFLQRLVYQLLQNRKKKGEDK